MPLGHPDKHAPLRPLTDHGWALLERLEAGPVRASDCVPSVSKRLVREGLAIRAWVRRRCFYSITMNGRVKLQVRADG